MSRDEERRPDPDALLAQTRHRGRLKIFFGANAGVGKTYAMLQEAQRLRAQGLDVLVGIVETHGRSETAALLEGLALQPLGYHFHRGRRLAEFDLDGVLARAPAVVLVDELAHSNVQGSRHPKRWQDVEELLEAGIDVFTTINVQHLESLNDIVGGITGILVRETVPDRLFDEADEIKLVDLSPEDLRQRLKEGKVYLPGQAERAIEHFFRKGNLMALRELALRRTAERVDDQMRAYRHREEIERVWHTHDALLVCLGPLDGSDKVVRTAARLAARFGSPWHAVYVETPRLHRLPESRRRQILQTLKLAGELGAETVTLAAQDEAQAVLDYAREHNLGKIVIGRRQQGVFWWRGRRFIDRLGKLGPDLDLIVVAVEGQQSARSLAEEHLPPDLRGFAERWQRQIVGSLATVLLGSILALFAHVLMPYLDSANLVMIFLLGVVLIALRYGRGPASLAAIIYVGLFDFFFVEPHFSFAVSDVQYLLTFAVMLGVGLIIGQMTAGVRYQARIAHYREQRARQLFELAKALSGAVSREEIARLSSEFVARSFHSKTQLLLPDEEQHLQVVAPHADHCEVDLAVAQWCLQHGSAVGLGTDTLPAMPQRLLPLTNGKAILGVLVVEPRHQRLLMIPEQLRLLELYGVLIAIALERIMLAREAEQAQLQMESERLRNSLLSALSHDLRTPLTVLFGQAEILTLELGLAQSPQVELASAMREQVLNTSRLVNNLLDMARLQSGGLALRHEWQSLPELLASARNELAVPLQGHRIDYRIPADFPLIYADGTMLERVLVNLLENGCKYAGKAATFTLGAELCGDELEIRVEDDGPGLPVGKEQEIFEKFARGDKESVIPGVGLGLAICRAIIEAHGGRIRAENRDEGGACFTFTLPYKAPPPLWEDIVEDV